MADIHKKYYFYNTSSANYGLGQILIIQQINC